MVIGEVGRYSWQHEERSKVFYMFVAGKKHGEGDNCCVDKAHQISWNKTVIDETQVVEYGVVDNFHVEPVVVDK